MNSKIEIPGVALHVLTRKERILNTVKTFGLFFFMALACIAIPLLHFILVPSFFILAVYMAIREYANVYRVSFSTERLCQNCQKKLDASYTADESLEVRCKKCFSRNALKKP